MEKAPSNSNERWVLEGFSECLGEVRLVDEDGNEVPLGQPGEVLLKTPSAALGFPGSQAGTQLLGQGRLSV